MLVLGVDIALNKMDANTASVDFHVLDKKAVQQFLEDTDMINFLTREYSPETGGCRLNITLSDETLTIARRLGPQTIVPMACSNLLSVLATYIIPAGREVGILGYSDWADMAGGLAKMTPEAIVTLAQPRGTELLGRDKIEDTARLDKK